MSAPVRQIDPTKALVQQVRGDEFKQQVALALPTDVSPERFVRVVVTALLDNPDLAEDPPSFFQACLKAAADGLLPDGREAALVQFKDKKTGIRKAQYLPMIGGYRKIAGEHGWTIRSAVVYENDRFEQVLGLNPDLIHVPPRPGQSRGPMIGAYAVGKHKDGRLEFEVMDAGQIDKVRQSSRAKDYGPWVDWPERMAEKTAARRLFKKLPLGGIDQAERVLAADDPADSAAALYGPGARNAFEDSPAPWGEPADGQAGGASLSPSPPPAPDQQAKANADAASRVKAPPDTVYGGLTIAQIAAKGGDGTLYFEWSLEPERVQEWADGTEEQMRYAQALPVWAAFYQPELLAGREEEAA